MTDPITASIAAALATGATAALTDAGKAMATRAVALVRDRFQRNPSDRTALETATLRPHDPAAVEGLARLLDQRMRDDPRFAEQLRALWSGADTGDGGRRGGVTNTVSGSVYGPVVQARDVHGGITFNTPDGPRDTEG